jgi:hypothetical protein
MPSLKISDDRHQFVTAEGRPFFYLADTAWELFHRLDRDEAEVYLKDRASKGFNVIQTVVLAETEGQYLANARGDRPLQDGDPRRPNAAFFDHVDWVVDRAASLGLYTAMVPVAGDRWHRRGDSATPAFSPAQAAALGEWLGKRYRDRPVLWMLGGERTPAQPDALTAVRAMANGLRQGDRGQHLMTCHPGENGTSEIVQREPWLDFNSRRSGQSPELLQHQAVSAAFGRPPVKPVIDAPPVYEDVPLTLAGGQTVYSNAADVRRSFYWSVFGGACGHTYGHHSIWQFHQEPRSPRLSPLMGWREALLQPGAFQMGIGRRLVESRPMAGRAPDDSLLAPSAVAPGQGRARLAAVRGAGGAYAMIYVPEGRPCQVRLDRLSGPAVNAWRFDPRTGAVVRLGTYPTAGYQTFVPPVRGEYIDWVLVLDASRGWPAPGAASESY